MSTTEFSERDLELRAVPSAHAMRQPPRTLDVIHAAARITGFTVEQLMSRDRHQSIAYARHVTMYVAKRVTGESLAEVSAVFGRDHTTSMRAIREMASLVGINAKASALAKQIEKEFA